VPGGLELFTTSCIGRSDHSSPEIAARLIFKGQCHLYRYLSREVNVLRNGDATFIPVAFPAGVKPRGIDDADGIMEWLDQRGVIERRWNKFKELMESARSLDMRRGQKDED
jgi:hypothetical protein